MTQHFDGLLDLARLIAFNLKNEHEWAGVTIHQTSPVDTRTRLPRPLISGIPRSRIYIHPDDQIEALARNKQGKITLDAVEREWVLPSHMREKWSLKRFAECFDAIGQEPPIGDEDPQVREKSEMAQRRGGKRMLLATLNDDSTVVYYVVHDGIVKPRQN